MERYYPILFIVAIILILAMSVGGRLLKRSAAQKSQERRAERLAVRQTEGREAQDPRYIGIHEAVFVGLSLDQIREILDKFTYLKKQEDGTWGTRSAFSRQYPYKIQAWATDGGTQIATIQYLVRNDVVDGEGHWRAIADHLARAAKKNGADFSYGPAPLTFTEHDADAKTKLYMASL